MSHVARIVAVLAAAALTSCGGGQPLREVLDSAQQEIWGTYSVGNSSRAEDLTTMFGANGAVVLVSVDTTDGEGRSCSGTVVSRRHVLTAGHCTVGAVGKYTIWFAQAPDRTETIEATVQRVWDVRAPAELSPSEDGGGKDVALLLLDELVPISLVKNIPRVNTGDVGDFIWRNRNQTFMVAGYGGHWPERRYGKVKKPKAMQLECNSGIFSVTGFTCLRFPELWLDFHGSQAKGESGDSGGPLFGFDEATGEYVLIGVRSGHRWWKSDITFDPNKQVFAPIGKLGKGGVQVASEIGEDADRDDVPDHLDNCKPKFCEDRKLPMDRCINPGQEDDDGDGIGDQCDNCPQWRCDMIGDGRSCQNVLQKDFDRDGVGDICDACPEVPSLEDKMPEGPIGKHCGCDGEVFDTCDDDLDCALIWAGKCIVDKDASEGVVGGFCSKLPDMDWDGIPDACDSCEVIPDTDDTNSNVHIEEEIGALKLGDVCDPVPIAPMEKGEPAVYPWWYVPIYGSGEPGVDFQELRLYPWMGANLHLPPDTFEQPLVFRHCSCFDAFGVRLDKNDCAKYLCPPSQAEFQEGDWKRATIGEQRHGSIVPISEGGLVLEFTHYARPSDPADKSVARPQRHTYYWMNYEDFEREDDPIGLKDGHAYGLLASVVVKKDGHFGSLRDANDDLRTVVESIGTPRIRHQAPPVAGAGPCEFLGCGGWLLREVEPYWNPNPTERLFEPTFDSIRYSAGDVGLLRRGGSFSDAVHLLSDELRELLSNGEWAWIPPSESPAALARKGVDRIGVLVPRLGTLGVSPVVLVFRDGQVTYDGVVERAATPEEVVEESQISMIDRAVYSAVQNRLYLAGFEHGWRAFTFGSDSLETAIFERSPSEDLRGLTFDVLNGRMFTLEIIDETQNQKVATVFVHDLVNGRSEKIWAAPFTGGFDRLALAADQTGSLVLMGSGASGFRACRYIFNGIDALVFKGSLAADGTITDEPLHSELKVPLLASDGTHMLLEMDVAEMNSGEVCTAL